MYNALESRALYFYVGLLSAGVFKKSLAFYSRRRYS